MTAQANPFAGQRYGDTQTYTLGAEDRINMVKRFDRTQCEAAMRLDGLQTTVERAIHARLRALAKQDRPQ